MADSSLDDFFAKKDKSKKKSKSSKVAAGDILPKAEDESKKKDKKKKVKEKSQTSTKETDNAEGNTIVRGEEDEWKEVEEEKEVDYSGLRIANLQVSEKEGEESEEQGADNAEEDEEDGEGREKREGQQGPWKASSQSTVTPTEVMAEEPPKPKEESKPTGKYIPPGQRAAAAAAASGATPSPTVPSHLRKKKVAPNIKSEEDFPTLGGAPGKPQPDSDPRSFEKVQHGGRQMEDPSKVMQQLSLGNKFSALQD